MIAKTLGWLRLCPICANGSLRKISLGLGTLERKTYVHSLRIEGCGVDLRRCGDSENRKVWRRGSLLAAIALLLSIPACSQEKPDDLANKGIEDLMNMGAKEIWSMGIT
jgi:hypothetical protein